MNVARYNFENWNSLKIKTKALKLKIRNREPRSQNFGRGSPYFNSEV